MPSTLLNGRYRVLDKVGEGTFGKVYLCFDRSRNMKVAIKVIKAVDRYVDAARIEADVLNSIFWRAEKTGERTHCVVLLKSFDYYGHPCLVFPAYDGSLYDLLRKRHYAGLVLGDVRAIGKQLMAGLRFLHAQEIVHTDLKPENILMRSLVMEKTEDGWNKAVVLDDATVRIIDFGRAVRRGDRRPRTVCTRHYRPPVVLLGVPWSRTVDIYSAGLILFELYVGEPLFQTHETTEHL